MVNARRTFSSDYAVLHRATCPHVSGPQEPGGFTERDYRKLCGGTLADVLKAPTWCGRTKGGVHDAVLALQSVTAGEGDAPRHPRLASNHREAVAGRYGVSGTACGASTRARPERRGSLQPATSPGAAFALRISHPGIAPVASPFSYVTSPEMIVIR